MIYNNGAHEHKERFYYLCSSCNLNTETNLIKVQKNDANKFMYSRNNFLLTNCIMQISQFVNGFLRSTNDRFV